MGLSNTYTSGAMPSQPAFPMGGSDYNPAGLQKSVLTGAANLLTKDNGGGGGGGMGGFFESIFGGGGEGLATSALNLGTNIFGGSAQQNNMGIGSILSNAAGSGLGKMLGTTNLSGGVWGAAANMATSGLSKILGKDMNYDDKAGQVMSQVTGGLKMLGPWGLAAGTALDMVNMIGSKYYEGTTTDKVNTGEVAGSYNTGNYEMEGQNISGIGRAFGAGKRFKEERAEKQRKLNTIADIGQEARTDRLRQQGGTNAVALRNQMESIGGYQALHVKNGGIMVDWEFLRRIHKKVQSMQQGGSVKSQDMPLDFVERMEVQNGTKGTIGKDSETQDSQTKKATKNNIDDAQKESSKTSNSLGLGLENLTNLYGNNVLKAQDGLKMSEPKMSMKEFFDILRAQGKMTDTYDYERFYLDDEAFDDWMKEEEEKGYGMGHFTDKYKKPGHVTYSSESVITIPGRKGGTWSYEGDEEYFTPEQWQIDLFGGWDKYKEAFEREYGKGSSRRIKKGVVKKSFTGPSSGVVKHARGGKFNVIPSGALHRERHHIEDKVDGMEGITTKGIPVIMTNKAGEKKQQAEVEREEIIFTKQLTDKLEKLRKEYDEAEGDKAGEIARQAGALLADQILFNTKDNSGIMKRVKP